ncbi:hypothetical protein FACS189499_02270 [Clostridia bacterium]|nr:hypothetical protein FACS189499_02270 [Clostridia bacterium]
MRVLKYTSQYRKDEKLMRKQNKDMGKLDSVLLILMSGATVAPEYDDHALIGVWKKSRELHIEPDWLLIYQTYENGVLLERTGSHSELFKK